MSVSSDVRWSQQGTSFWTGCEGGLKEVFQSKCGLINQESIHCIKKTRGLTAEHQQGEVNFLGTRFQLPRTAEWTAGGGLERSSAN